MKKILIFLFFVFYFNLMNGQSASDTSYLFLEAEGQFSLNRPSSINGNYYYQWSRMSVQNSKGFGVYAEISQDTSYFGVGLGILKTITSKPYWEINLGPELDMYRYDTKTKFAFNVGTYFATKPDDIRARGKVELYFTYWVSGEDSWYSSYALVSPFKWLSLGAFSQAYIVEPGPMVRINLPIMRPWISWSKTHFTVGMNMVGEWERVKRKKN